VPKKMTQELQFHPSRNLLAITYVDGSIALWDADAGAIIQQQRTSAEELYTVDWSTDGSLLVTAGRNGTITLWRGEDLSQLHELDGPPWVVRAKFSPDGMNLLTAGGSVTPGGPRSLQVWGVETSLYSWLKRPSDRKR
jgi:WD40 repeat protein